MVPCCAAAPWYCDAAPRRCNHEPKPSPTFSPRPSKTECGKRWPHHTLLWGRSVFSRLWALEGVNAVVGLTSCFREKKSRGTWRPHVIGKSDAVDLNHVYFAGGKNYRQLSSGGSETVPNRCANSRPSKQRPTALLAMA
jgi:hypothetical protein